MHDEFTDVFTGIVCNKGTFFLQVKEDMKPYQALPKNLTYGLHEPFKMKEYERLNEHQKLASLGVDKKAE